MNDDARPEETESAPPNKTSAGKAQYVEGADGVVQLRFADDDNNIHSLNAAEMAEAIQGLVEFTSQMASSGMFGEGAAPQLRVRPPREGSFILETVVQFYNTDPHATLGMAGVATAGLAQSLRVGFRRLRGEEPTDFEYLDNGDVKLTWRGGRVDQVPSKAWDELRTTKRQTRKALRKLMAPLSDDADTLEVRDGQVDQTTSEILRSEPDVVASRDDYRIAVHDPEDIDEHVSEFDAEAQLQSIDFRQGGKWTIKTLEGTRQATMEDDEFTRQLDHGLALHKNDIFEVTIREVRTVKNGRSTRDWSLIKVSRKRRGGDDDRRQSSSGDPSTAQ